MIRTFLIFILCLGVTAPLFAQVPPTPSNVSAELQPNTIYTVKLTWEAPSGGWQYRVYRSVNDTDNFHPIATVPGRSFYDHGAVPGHTYFYHVTSIILGGGTSTESPRSNIANITIALPVPPPRGTIAGTVIDDTTSQPIRLVRIRFFRVNNLTNAGPVVFTDSMGQYHALLDTGRYFVKAEPTTNSPALPGYRSEYFDDAPTIATATAVAVAESSLFVANFGLSRPTPPPPPPHGTIAGTVIDDTTLLPLRHVRMRFFRMNGPSNWCPDVFTDSLGHYQALLDTGRYLVKAEPGGNTPGAIGYRSEYFDNAPSPLTATPVAVAENSLFVANFGLSRPTPPTFANISGTVTDTGGVALQNANVTIMRTMQNMNFLAAVTGSTPGLGEESMDVEGVGRTNGVLWNGRTDSLGHYQARVISGMSYIALSSKTGYLPEYFDNASNPMDADIIAVHGDTSGIDFSLAANPQFQNSVSGVVRDSSGTRVPSRIVLIPRHGGGFNGLAHTDSLGAYSIHHVRTGKYFVLALPFSGYAPAFYKAGAYGVIHWQDADTVTISGDVTGIDIGVLSVSNNGIVQVGGQVQSTTGARLEGVGVIAVSQHGVAGYGITDGEGNYVIDAVPSGVISVHPVKFGYEGSASSLNVSSGTYIVNNVNFVLSEPSLLSVNPAGNVPDVYELQQNYPNPFNPTTTISYTIPMNSPVTVKVFNLLGQEVATLVNGDITAGDHKVVWDGKDYSGRTVASGVYLYRLKATAGATARQFTQARKMVFIK